MRFLIEVVLALLLVVLAQRTLAGQCVRDCSTHCTRYERLECAVQLDQCSQTVNIDEHIRCLNQHIPCYNHRTHPTNNTCWSSYLCCLEFNSTNDEDALQECLRFADLCVDLTGLAFDRCVWRVRCNRSQPIRRENTPPMQNLCFTRRQQNCSCINKRFFNAEITCDMTSSCCLPRKSYSSELCAAFSSYLGGNTNTEKRAEGYNDMIGDEGVIIANDSAKDAGRNWKVRHSRKKASGVFQRTVPVHGRPVWDNSAIIIKKRQGQASTCGLDKNYYPEVPFRYNVTACRRVAPFYTVEFVQALMLNFTYIMDLAPVGTT